MSALPLHLCVSQALGMFGGVLLQVLSFSTRVNGLPTILSEPQDHSTAESGVITLSLQATGIPPLTYQWYYTPSGQRGELDASYPITDAIGPTYTPPYFCSTWGWWVRVTDATGFIDSRVAIVTVPESVSFQAERTWPPFFQWMASAVRVHGAHAYVCAGALQIFDIGDPVHPVRVTGYNIDGDLQDRGGIFINDGHLYLTSHYGLQIYDLADPIRPGLVGSISLNASDVFVLGHYAYLSGLEFQIVDVSDFRNLVKRSRYPAQRWFTGVRADDKFAYFADGNLNVLDVSDPVRPQLVGTLPGMRGILDVKGSYAYVCGSDAALTIVDISNASQPTRVSAVRPWPNDNRLSDWPQDVQVVGDNAYVCGGSVYPLLIVDVSDPKRPRELGLYNGEPATRGGFVSGDYVYVGAALNGLSVIDVRDSTRPNRVGGADTQRIYYGIEVSGTRAYVQDGSLVNGGGFQVFGNDTEFLPLGRYDTISSPFPMKVAGKLVYLVNGGTNLDIVDVTDAAKPFLVGRYAGGKSVNDLYLAGHYAYLAESVHGLVILDVSDATTPTKVAQLMTGANAVAVGVRGTFAYLVDNRTGLHVIDVSNPAFPREVGTNALVDVGSRITFEGTLAMVQGFGTLDLSDPINPVVASRKGGTATDNPKMSVAYDTSYGAGFVRLDAWDFTKPTQPSRVGSYQAGVPQIGNTGSSAASAEPAGERVFFSTGISIDVLSLEDWPPKILRQPESQSTVFGGATPVLEVEASGALPLTYEWYSGLTGDISRPVPDANQSRLAVSPTVPVSRFWVRVSNSLGSADSMTATVTVCPRLSFLRNGPSSLAAELIAPPGTRWRVDRSTDLRSWEPEANPRIIDVTQFPQTLSLATGKEASVFYRLTWVP